MKDIILLLGGNILNYGIQKKFHQKGFQVYVVDWNQFPRLTGDRHYQIDVKDADAILATLKNDNVLDRVAMVYTSIDLAVPSVVRIHREIGLATMGEEALLYANSKSAMTGKWKQAGLLNRQSISCIQFSDDLYLLNQKMKLIVKPDNSASSRGITVIEKESAKKMLKKAFDRAFQEASDDKVVIEEYVEGTEFTVEMLGDYNGHVAVYGISRKYHTAHTNSNRIAIKLHYNAVSQELQEYIAEYAIKCYKALGFRASLGHLEILLKDDGTLSPVEIGARSSGWIASDLVDIVSGTDYLGDLMEVLHGANVDDGLKIQTRKSAMYFFYDFPPGTTVMKQCNLLDFCPSGIQSRYFDRSAIAVGQRFEKIDNDNARHGFEILEGTKELMTIDCIIEAEKRMLSAMLGEENNV